MMQAPEGMDSATHDLELNRQALLSLNKKYVNSDPKIKGVIEFVAKKLEDLHSPYSFEDIVQNLTYIEDHFMFILDTYFKEAKWYNHFEKTFISIKGNCQQYLRSGEVYQKVKFKVSRPRGDPEKPDESFRGDDEVLDYLHKTWSKYYSNNKRTQHCDICNADIIGYNMQDMITNGGKELYPGAQPWVKEPDFEVIMACICSVKCGQKKRAKELQFIRSKGIRAKRQANIHVQEACPICFTVSIKLMKCGACKCAYYCSVECQKKDWSSHKETCKEMTQKQKEGLLF